MIVIDASLAVKWFLEEPDSDAARQKLADNLGQITVPDLFVIEVTAALVRNANIHKRTYPATREHIADFVALLAGNELQQVRPTPPQVAKAANLALDLGHPLKDCIYLALAMELGCDLVTCDARFAAKAKGVWDRVRVLGGDGSRYPNDHFERHA